MKARTEFERYYLEEFHQELDAVVIPPEHLPAGERPDFSWDRRAAYLVWCAREGISAFPGRDDMGTPIKPGDTVLVESTDYGTFRRVVPKEEKTEDWWD
jgi:hypothetical protein